MKEINIPEEVKVFKLMGDENRYKILQLLLENDLCVGALAFILNLSKPAVSQHLKILREAGLVIGEKRGYWTHYQVNRQKLKEAARVLEKMANYSTRVNNICLQHEEETANSKEERGVLPVCKNCCHKPENLKSTPQECSPEQIKDCHGDDKEHPCTEENPSSEEK